MNPVQQLLSQAKKQQVEEVDYLSLLHHALMKAYGWIPYEEFKKLPIPTVIDLIEQINNDIEAEQKAIKEANKKSKR